MKTSTQTVRSGRVEQDGLKRDLGEKGGGDSGGDAHSPAESTAVQLFHMEVAQVTLDSARPNWADITFNAVLLPGSVSQPMNFLASGLKKMFVSYFLSLFLLSQ